MKLAGERYLGLYVQVHLLFSAQGGHSKQHEVFEQSSTKKQNCPAQNVKSIFVKSYLPITRIPYILSHPILIQTFQGQESNFQDVSITIVLKQALLESKPAFNISMFIQVHKECGSEQLLFNTEKLYGALKKGVKCCLL